MKLVVANACGSDSITMNLANVSLGENPLAQSLKLYPSPAKSFVTIELNSKGDSEVQIRVLDMSGKVIMTSTRDNVGKTMKSSIDISGLANGVYMIELSDGRNNALKRFNEE